MNTNLTFTYEASALFDKIDADTSRIASHLRLEGGASAYDILKIHTNERPTINGYISEAFNSILSKFADEAKHTLEGDLYSLMFYLPDFDLDNFSAARSDMQDYIVHSATARWLLNRSFADNAKVMAADAELSLNKAISILRARKSPLNI